MGRLIGLAPGLAIVVLALAGCSKPATTTSPRPPETVAPKPAQAAPPATPTDAPAPAPPPIADPLAIGSQAAKDDLYCSALIFATYAPGSGALSPTEEAVRMRNEGMGMVIANAGADKLMAEGVARVTQLGAIADAYSDQVDKDLKAKKPRLKLDACMKRAEAIPRPPQ